MHQWQVTWCCPSGWWRVQQMYTMGTVFVARISALLSSGNYVYDVQQIHICHMAYCACEVHHHDFLWIKQKKVHVFVWQTHHTSVVWMNNKANTLHFLELAGGFSQQTQLKIPCSWLLSAKSTAGGKHTHVCKFTLSLQRNFLQHCVFSDLLCWISLFGGWD